MITLDNIFFFLSSRLKIKTIERARERERERESERKRKRKRKRERASEFKALICFLYSSWPETERRTKMKKEASYR